jgi:hypothetical protein
MLILPALCVTFESPSLLNSNDLRKQQRKLSLVMAASIFEPTDSVGVELSFYPKIEPINPLVKRDLCLLLLSVGLFLKELNSPFYSITFLGDSEC